MNYKKILKEKKTLITVLVIAAVIALILAFSSFTAEEVPVEEIGEAPAEEVGVEPIVEEPVETVPEEIEEEPAEEPVTEVAEEVVEAAEAEVYTTPEPTMWYACIKSGTRTERCEGVSNYWKENKWSSDDNCVNARDERAKPCAVYDCGCTRLRE